MTVIKINAITVPADSGDELARRFAARAGAVDDQPGFEGFELLKPVDDRTTWLVVTRWADEEAFQAWVNSPSFGAGHRGTGHSGGGEHGDVAGHGGGEHSGGHHAGHGGGAGHAGGAVHADAAERTSGASHAAVADQENPQKPVAVSSELWSYEVAGGSPR